MYFGASLAPRIEHAASQIHDSSDLSAVRTEPFLEFVAGRLGIREAWEIVEKGRSRKLGMWPEKMGLFAAVVLWSPT